jgi:D-galactarolactone cycloisomerase
MRIESVDVIPLGIMGKTPAIYRSFAIIRIITDSGVVGYGEASDSWGHEAPLVIKAIVDEELSRFILGEDPMNIEKLTIKMQGYVANRLGLFGVVMQAMSGVEVALWDIAGKVKNEPIYKMLGAHRDLVPLYIAGQRTLEPKPPEWHVHVSKPYLERGFKAFKIRTGFNKKWDTEIFRGLREILGDDIDLMADAFSNYTVHTALKIAKELGEYDVFWLEEPIPERFGIEALSRIVESSNVPIAYGEHTFGINGFKDLIVNKAVDIIEPDATVCGGFLEARKICMLANAWGIPVATHCGSATAIGLAADLHLSASIPNLTYFEYSVPNEEPPLRDTLLKDPIFSLDHVRDGCLELPQKPGLGIEIDEKAFDNYVYKKRGIEKEMPVYGVPHM